MITSKKCGGCGFDNDTLLTNCICCKKPLPSVNPDEISNETLIMEGSKWVGNAKERVIVVDNTNIWSPTTMINGQIVGIAKQYVSMIKVRGYSNEIMQNMGIELEKDLTNNINEVTKKKRTIYYSFLLAFLGIMILYLCLIFKM